MVPAPAEPYDSFPGFSLMYAISSVSDFAGTEGFTAIAKPVIATIEIGVRSFVGLSRGCSRRMASVRLIEELPRKIVYPSAGACATAAAANEPPAPGWFSTMTVPRSGCNLAAKGRPTMSNTPPGGNGNTSLIGRDGKVSARPATGSAAAAPAKCKNLRR